MKQSTKLLSLVLALLIAFSCMSVIGSAVLIKEEVSYDIIDDADLSYEQVADIALDLVDDLLKDADTCFCARVFLYWRTKNMEVKLYETIN